ERLAIPCADGLQNDALNECQSPGVVRLLAEFRLAANERQRLDFFRRNVLRLAEGHAEEVPDSLCIEHVALDPLDAVLIDGGHIVVQGLDCVVETHGSLRAEVGYGPWP